MQMKLKMDIKALCLVCVYRNEMNKRNTVASIVERNILYICMIFVYSDTYKKQAWFFAKVKKRSLETDKGNRSVFL